jgi:hypothetical protein
MRSNRVRRSVGAVALVGVLVLTACGGGGDGAESSDGGGSDGGWTIALYEGSSAVGPGTFSGGEVEISEEAVSQGLEDMETGTVATITGDTGESFDGGCFMIRQDDGRYEQFVQCGPFVAADGTTRWLKAGFSLRGTDGDYVGFEAAPILTSSGGGSAPGSPSDDVANLVRPDGETPNVMKTDQ